MKRTVATLIISMLMSCFGLSGSTENKKPEVFAVRDGAAAVTIAEAVLVSIYGRDSIRKQRPFKVREQDGIWVVYSEPKSSGQFGGTSEVRISKSGCILLIRASL
jgi:hypothetical protein